MFGQISVSVTTISRQRILRIIRLIIEMRCSASNCPTLHLSASAFPVISGLLAAGCWRSGTGLTTGHLTLLETLLHLQLQVTSASVVTAVTRGHVRVRVRLGGRLLRHPAGPPLRHPQGAAAGPQPDQRARHPPELRPAGALLRTAEGDLYPAPGRRGCGRCCGGSPTLSTRWAPSTPSSSACTRGPSS